MEEKQHHSNDVQESVSWQAIGTNSHFFEHNITLISLTCAHFVRLSIIAFHVARMIFVRFSGQ